jgi:hypothetical protein
LLIAESNLLVLEKIIKRRACIIRPLTALTRRLFLHHYADGKKPAVVAFVLGRNARGNRLVALEAARRIKVFALLAGMQSESAFRTLSYGIGEILQQRPAFSTPRDGARSRHVDGPRSESIFLLDRRGLLKFFFRSPAGTGILVSTLPILAIVGQKRLREAPSFSAFGDSGTSVCLVIVFKTAWSNLVAGITLQEAWRARTR